MKKTLFFYSVLILVFSACTNESLPDYNAVSEKRQPLEFSVEIGENVDLASIGEGDTLHFTPIVTCLSKDIPQTKAGDMIEVKGSSITRTTTKTYWKYGVGEDKVPLVFTTDATPYPTVSYCYTVSIVLDMSDPNIMYRGFTGEWSGYSGATQNNTQERYQAQKVDPNTNTITFSTFIWDIKSDSSGKNYGYTECYVPFKGPEQARLYYRVYQ